VEKNVKDFFFLAGLQRSGATILSSVLNQNPNVWVSPASPLFRFMKKALPFHNEIEALDYDRNAAINNTIMAMPHSFYADKEAKHIIDKNLNWPSDAGVEIIGKYITKNVKIICPVRNILDILASFDTIINLNPESNNNKIDIQVIEESQSHLPMADRRAEWLMRYDKDIPLCLGYLRYAMIPEFRHIFHFVEYDEFITNPQQEIEKVYEFLGIEKYNHEFENIEDPTGISELSFTGIKNLHKIRPSIKKISKNPEDIFLPETIKRFAGMEFWRGIK